MDKTAFDRLCQDHWQSVLAYALRRTDGPEDAADVVSEVFVVAWRRRAEVPLPPEDRLWLFGVARLVLTNHRRGLVRRTRLNSRLSLLAERMAPDPAEVAAQCASERTLLEALAALPERDRELLTLVAWDDLTPSEAATALGISGVTARVRLHRARHRLRRCLDADDAKRASRGGHVLSDRQPPVSARETS